MNAKILVHPTMQKTILPGEPGHHIFPTPESVEKYSLSWQFEYCCGDSITREHALPSRLGLSLMAKATDIFLPEHWDRLFSMPQAKREKFFDLLGLGVGLRGSLWAEIDETTQHRLIDRARGQAVKARNIIAMYEMLGEEQAAATA